MLRCKWQSAPPQVLSKAWHRNALSNLSCLSQESMLIDPLERSHHPMRMPAASTLALAGEARTPQGLCAQAKDLPAHVIAARIHVNDRHVQRKHERDRKSQSIQMAWKIQSRKSPLKWRKGVFEHARSVTRQLSMLAEINRSVNPLAQERSKKKGTFEEFPINSFQISGGNQMINEMPTRRSRIGILKVRPGAEYLLTCASEDPFTFFTHWMGARSYMCPGNECPACAQQIGAKWVGLMYVAMSVDEQKKTVHGMIELTEPAWYRMKDLATMLGTEIGPGLSCSVSRKGRKSPLIFRPILDEEKAPVPGKIMKMTQIADATATLYSLPSLEPGQEIKKWSERAKTRARSLLSAQLRRLT